MGETSISRRIGRRTFLHNGVVCVSSAMLSNSVFADDAKRAPLRIGLMTDMHYADKPAAGTRHYRETLGKLEEAAVAFERFQPTCIVELGDFIDAADSVATEKRYLDRINREFTPLCKDRHYVLGNHCVDTLTKAEFLGGVGQERSYYSFDREGIHFVVLDACFRSDGTPYERKNFRWTDANIPESELEWLAADLKSTGRPTIVFAHQRLDVSNNHGVKNQTAVRGILEQSGNVSLVLQGHSHKNDLREVNGIPYCTLVAMVEGAGPDNNGYSLMEIQPTGLIKLTGFRKQKSRRWNEKG